MPPVRGTDTIAGLGQPIVYGEMVLVAGTVNEVAGLGLFTANNVVQISRRVLGGGALGDLSFTYVPATGVLTITSSNAAEVSTVQYVIRG